MTESRCCDAMDGVRNKRLRDVSIRTGCRDRFFAVQREWNGWGTRAATNFRTGRFRYKLMARPVGRLVRKTFIASSGD